MDMAEVGFGPAYDCRAERTFGDREGVSVNPELSEGGFGHEKSQKVAKTPGGCGMCFLRLPEFRSKDSDWRLDPLWSGRMFPA
jgi:hypothetical protein